jgi:hypothetical protein
MWLKGCPRCGGDLMEERLDRLPEVKCLQCSGALNDRQRTYLFDRTRAYLAERRSGGAALRAAS